jgi:hypothetical protein
VRWRSRGDGSDFRSGHHVGYDGAASVDAVDSGSPPARQFTQTPLPMRRPLPLPLFPSILAVATALSGCTGLSGQSVYDAEGFDAQSAFSRSFPVQSAVACDGARRALLSQGYLVAAASAAQVGARKSFQPRGDSHVQIEFNVVCADNGVRSGSTVFVSAVQDRFALKKAVSSASVGIGPLGYISLPFSGGSDSLVKVASETIRGGQFYRRFFELIEHHLADIDASDAELSAHSPDATSPTPPGTGSR